MMTQDEFVAELQRQLDQGVELKDALKVIMRGMVSQAIGEIVKEIFEGKP